MNTAFRKHYIKVRNMKLKLGRMVIITIVRNALCLRYAPSGCNKNVTNLKLEAVLTSITPTRNWFISPIFQLCVFLRKKAVFANSKSFILLLYWCCTDSGGFAWKTTLQILVLEGWCTKLLKLYLFLFSFCNP